MQDWLVRVGHLFLAADRFSLTKLRFDLIGAPEHMSSIWMTYGVQKDDTPESIKSTDFLRISEISGAKIARMKKDTRLTFRVNSHLKRDVEAIAAREGQSVARICEAFLLVGSDAYKKQGPKLLERILGRLDTKRTD